jgi:alpha-N-arabinofuranosidase
VDPSRPARIEATISGVSARSARGEILTAPAVDAVNSFAAPAQVAPKPYAAEVRNGTLIVDMPAKSVVVVEVGS